MGMLWQLAGDSLTPEIINQIVTILVSGVEARLAGMTNHDVNKQNVTAVSDMMFNQGKPREAVELNVGNTYIQHNSQVADGPEGFIEYFDLMAAQDLGKQVEFKRVIAEGEFVVLPCSQTWPGSEDSAGIDICRLDANDKIVKHWDVLQELPEISARTNEMF